MRKLIHIFILFASAALVACGGGGGGGVSASSLAGSWYGTHEDGSGNLSTLSVTVDDTGKITSIVIGGSSTGLRSTAPVAKDIANNIFSFVLTDGTEGGFFVNSAGTHAAFVDDGFNVGVLQKSATSLPTFVNADLVGAWNGFTVETDDFFEITETYNSNASVTTDGTFSGSDKYGAFNGIFGDADISFGRWQGEWIAGDGSAGGPLSVFMSADKSFVASWACNGSSNNFPGSCSYSAWTR